MAKKELTWEDLDLSTRATMAVSNMPPYLKDSPAALKKALTENYAVAVTELLRIPNCGRGTVDELIEALEFKKPEGVGPRLSRFASEDDLLEHLFETEGVEATKLDRPGLLMMLDLVAKDWATKHTCGLFEITKAGRSRLDMLRAERPVTLTLKGKLSVIKALIESLPDQFGEPIDVHMQELESEGRITVELDG